MGPGSATHRRRDAALRPGHETFVEQQTHLRPLAACFARALLRRLTLVKEGAGKTGSRLAPIDRYAMSRLRYNAQRVTGQPEHPGLPCAVVGTAYVVLSPGSDALLPPSPCGWLMGAPGWAAHITTRLGAQTPGARTTRFGRTRITPVVRATPSLTALRPAITFAPMWPTSTAARPAFVTIAIAPLPWAGVRRNIRNSEFR